MGTLTVDNLNVNSTASITSGAGIVLQQITVAVAKATFTSAIPDDDTQQRPVAVLHEQAQPGRPSHNKETSRPHCEHVNRFVLGRCD